MARAPPTLVGLFGRLHAWSRWYLAGLVVLVVVAPAGAVATDAPANVAAPAGPDPAPDHTSLARAGAATPPDADNTATRIDVRADGSARWTVQVRTRLDSEHDVEQYRAFQERFRGNTSRYLDPFAERIGGVVGDAAGAAGREMTATDFTASTSIQEVPRRWGVVTFSFTWTNFARVEGERLVVGDVFEGGFYLGDEDSLSVAAPDGYAVETVEPDPADADSNLVTWEGREDFADRRPYVELAPAGAASSTATATPTVTATPGGPAGGLSPATVGAAALALAVLAGGVVLARRRSDGPGELVGESGDAGSDDRAAPSGEDGATVLTDGERVERLLAEGGGRMKQAAVADELGWSASKTSRVVADLVEEGRVEKLRVGRENLLALRDVEDGGG